ncbi:MAG TPA: DUF2330 domain-containing protein, partial [Polyangiaceae bacterium LLY-WYZ-15_(1-7)]|nr:DUF2330 domain-containing protein [Polyangiaceae bacterium LLY-WYZ-15_(1-7)]
MRAFTIATAAAALALLPATRGHAFCGFYVAGADAELFNDATNVVLLREGTTTVLSMQNDYRGPTEDFAMVVPVPVILEEGDVKTLPRDVFERVDTLAAPRLVEYWEQDPCAGGEGTIGLGNLGTIGFGAGGGGAGYGRGAGRLQVRVEAEFAVGEYEIVILSAEDSGDLDTWLRQNDYRIPEGAGEALRPYVEGGMKFFVAKVDAERARFEDGRAVLSPLRIHYDSESFALPVRLGMLNSSGTQDLLVHVLARNQRYEVANYENVTIPTNIDVADATRERFGEFYAALFDRTLEAHPNAVVTEYAWQATGCDPCPGPVLSASDLMTLGADVALGLTPPTPPQPTELQPGPPETGEGLPSEVVRRVVRRHLNELRFCAGQGGLPGAVVELGFSIDPAGAVRGPSAGGVDHAPRVKGCVETALRRWRFPQPEAGRTVPVRYVLRIPAGGGSPGGQLNQFVLTRLHYRYGRGELGDDLVFRPAEAIVGGRERRSAEGELERGATPDTFNNFQGRYVIRHAWEGEVACENPRRGIWGGRPAGEGEERAGASEPETTAATGTARAPRGELRLASLLKQAIPTIGIASLELGAAADAEASGGGEDEASGAGDLPPSPEDPEEEERAGGCGGCATGRPAAGPTLFFAAAA